MVNSTAISELPAELPESLTLDQIEVALQNSWGDDTCDESEVPQWSTANPSLGQCAASAYVVNDLLGGRLLGAEVHNPDGSLQGHHYWNLLDGGVEVDLTREQFKSGEIVQTPDVMDRIHAVPNPGGHRYLVLRERVLSYLGIKP